MEQRLWGFPGGLRAVFWGRMVDTAEDHLPELWSDSWDDPCLLPPLALGRLELKQQLVPTTSRAAERGLILTPDSEHLRPGEGRRAVWKQSPLGGCVAGMAI